MKDWFDELKNGLLIISIKGDIRQPHNYAMGRIPARFLRWHTASQYFYDIERIFKELKSSISFVKIVPDDSFLIVHSTTSEEYIMYHQGYFLDLIHQLKDKLCQLIKAMITHEKNYNKKYEKITLNKLLKDEYLNKSLKIINCLKEWDDNNQNGTIARALKKRTQYHHFKNPLSSIKDYVDARTYRFLLSPSFQSQLSNYGRQIILKKSEQSLKDWQNISLSKMEEIFSAIDKNIQDVSRGIILHLNLPKKDKKSRRILSQYIKLDDITKVKNSKYTKDNINTEFKNIVLNLEKILQFALEKELISFYLNGSLMRDSFIFGVSDINIVIIIKNNNADLKTIIERFISKPPKEFGIPIDIKILTEQEFFLPEYEKLRFICKTDGLLVSGMDLLKNEKQQNICFGLAWMLNKDFKDYIVKLKEKLLDVQLDIPDRDIELATRDLAKRAYRLIFSQVIGNNTLYSSDFRKMRELNNYFYPKNRGFNEKTYSLTINRFIITKDSLLSIINDYEKKLFPLYEAIDRAVNGEKEKAN